MWIEVIHMKINDLERNSQFLYLTEAVVNVAYLPPTKHSFEFPSGLECNASREWMCNVYICSIIFISYIRSSEAGFEAFSSL